MNVPEQHRAKAPQRVGVYVITCSTSRFNKQSVNQPRTDDPSGDIVVKYCENAGHFVVGRTLLPDDRRMIQKAMANAVSLKSVDVIIINGGTGISPTDVTVESVQKFLAKVMRGFGELFRRISYETIGPAAMMSRALAGVTREGKAVFCLPGSPDGVDTAMRKLIVPELPHIVKLARGS